MISDLKEIVEHRIRRPLHLTALRNDFAGQALDSPARSLSFAASYCQAALPCLAEAPDDSVAAVGADLLIHFLAELPLELRQSINNIKDFAPPSLRAWHEPSMDQYVGLCSIVHDIWAHLLGPESKDDANIVQRLLDSPARQAIDFGAGAGHFCHELALHGIAVDAIEPDIVKCAFLSYRAQRAGLENSIRIGPRPVAYDLGLAVNVLDHMENPAEAIHRLATYLAPGARLFVLAAFPIDGWHQSDEVVIDNCGEEIWKYFTPNALSRSNVAWLESFIRRSGQEPTTGARIAQLHPAARWNLNEHNEVVLSVNSRFCCSCILNQDAAHICRQLQGREFVEPLAARNGVATEEVSGLCDSLREQRLMTWSPG